MTRVAGAWALPCLVAATAVGQSVTLLEPRGVQVGTETSVTVRGRDLEDTVGVVRLTDGIDVLGVEPVDRGSVVLRLRVAADCALGGHGIMLHTKRGLTRMHVLRVGPLPSVAETDAEHGSPETAQVVPLDVSIDGGIERGAVDCYAVEVPEGCERLQIELEGVRLADADWDPVVEVFDASGRRLLRADDSALGRLDPIASLPVEPGVVCLAVRDLGYGGSRSCAYRLHVGTFPRPTGVLGATGRPGEVVTPRWLGDGAGRALPELRLPDALGVQPVWPTDGERTAPTPVFVHVTEAAVLREGSDPAVLDVPCAAEGRLAAPGEQDRFRFRAQKGERLVVRSLARALRSPLDSVLEIRDAAGKTLTSDDDSGGPDSRIRFRVPSDGEYEVAVRDHLGRGGDTWRWHVVVEPEREALVTREAVPGRRGEDFGVAVPRGGRAATVISAAGLDRSAGIRLGFTPLPDGVTCAVPAFPEGVDLVPVVFTAAPDAALERSLAAPTATAAVDPREREVQHRQPVPLLRVRNDLVWEETTVDRLPIVVTDTCPFAVELEPPAVPLVRAAGLRLRGRIVRAAGFDRTVTVRMLWTPPGVSAGSVTVRADREDFELPLNASGRAPAGTWPICLVASAADGRVERTVASALVTLETCEPWISVDTERVRTDQGTRVRLPIMVEAQRAFDGVVSLTLERLPKGVTAAPLEVRLPASDVAFDLEVAPDAAVGRHRRAFVSARVPSPGGDVAHVFGGVEIRVDVPLEGSGAAGGSR